MSEPEDTGWKWFPNVKTDWSLDVVNLLVVIGEQAMIEHAQPITASLLCMLPRIIPAPQVFLKPTRPARMPEVSAKMTGIYSGINIDSVGYFANIITPLDEYAPFSFQVLEITHSEKCRSEDAKANRPMSQQPWLRRTLSKLLKDSSLSSSSYSSSKKHDRNGSGKTPHLTPPTRVNDEESIAVDSGNGSAQLNGGSSTRDFAAATQTGGANGQSSSVNVDGDQARLLQRRKSTKETVQDLISYPTMAVSGDRPAVPAHLFSPIHILGVLSFLVSIAILVCAVMWEDGNAILAISLISLMSSVVGLASFWRPLLMSRRHSNEVPDGDVLIRTREGAFILVRCTEDVARELYSGTEECQYYVTGRTYRLLMAVGTVLLMVAVVLLGNCTWNSQVFIGGTYIILNGLYWGCGMLPRRYFWDLSRYTWVDVTPDDAKRADAVTNEDDQREGHPSFTRTLWYVIRETKRTGWVRSSGAAPGTAKWKKWLSEAGTNAKNGNRGWNAVERKNVIMSTKKANKRGDHSDSDDDDSDEAAEHVPATRVNESRGSNQETSFL